LNYNGKKYLKDCLDSLLRSSYPNYEIIVIDNNSSDDSVAFIAQNYEQLKLIRMERNEGYSRAYNLAFKHAKGKYFVLLNFDVITDHNWLTPLVQAAEKDSNIAALQPKLLSTIDKGYFEYAGASGGYIDKYGYPFLRGRIFYTIEKDNGQYNSEADVFWTSGAALFIRSQVLIKSGSLDEDFFLHMEEIDLCWRLNLLGYRLKVIPESIIFHHVGASLPQGSFMKYYWNHRNNIIMLIKNLERKKILKTLIGRLFFDLINIKYSILLRRDLNHAFAILKAYGWIVTHFKLILKKRKEIQRLRLVSDKNFEHLIYRKSLIIDYFIKGKKTFQSIEF
jgi:GT2 family glycosyltransferase